VNHQASALGGLASLSGGVSMSVNRSLRQYGAGVAMGAALVAGTALWNSSQHAQAVGTAAVAGAAADDLSEAFRKVAAECLPSIVSIESVTKAREVTLPGGGPGLDEFPFGEFFQNDPRFREFFRQMPQQRRGIVPRRRAAGSGFIIDAAGVVMTNCHVVAGADSVKVKLHDGREFTATDIKTDTRTDVAIVRINGASNLKPLQMGDSRKVEIGDWVLAFGSPFGLDMTVTQGIISGKSRARGIAEREDFLQTDAAINPGNSGGPLVNLKGEVIGINTAIASASGGYDGIGFAIPTHIAQWVGHQLVSNGAVKRGYLGTAIAPVDAATAQRFKVGVNEGAIVREVRPNSPAEKAGVEPGDVILTLNGEKVRDPATLQGIVEQLDLGKNYPLEVVRNGQRQVLKVTIEEMPSDYTARSDSPRSGGSEKSFNNLGLQVKPLTNELAKQLGLANAQGVVVTGVEPNSVAEQAGVRQGDLVERVGNTPVTSVEEFQKALEGLSLKDGVVLHLRNAEGRRFVIVQDDGAN
jgi:serine protease Do